MAEVIGRAIVAAHEAFGMCCMEIPNSVKRADRMRGNGICECHRVPQLPSYGEGCGKRIGVGKSLFRTRQPGWTDRAATLENCTCLVQTCSG